MPNWCYNKLTVTGPAADIAAFVDQAHGPVQQFALTDAEREWLRQEGRDLDEPPAVEVFCFHRLVPLPPEALSRPYDDGSRRREAGYRQGFTWEIELWGIRWGAQKSKLAQKLPCRVTYTYKTPWGPGGKFFENLTKRWPTLTFALSYGEESPSCGRLAYRGGEPAVAVHEFPAEDQDKYLDTHEQWEPTAEVDSP